MNVIFRVCENLIDKNRVEGMEEKLSKLLLFSQLSQEEYGTLMEQLNSKSK